jgi:ATP-binding cassette subfamily B protein IrtB
VALLIVMVRFLEPFSVLTELSSAIESSRGLLSRLRAVVDAPRESTGTLSSVPARAPRIEFRTVGFSYKTADGRTEVLRDLSFTLEPGSTTAIVGPSGSGKTTVLFLIAGLLRPDHGQILVDGVDVADLDPDARRALVSVVFQHPYLFDGSIAENIRVADPGATDEAYRSAVALARVEAIGDGDQGRVGEAGTALSGGERQRVSIARALLKPSAILAVDEGTSALDAENETAVIDAIRDDPLRRTRVMIAHRLDAIRIADHVLFLEDGALVEQGGIDDLRALGGRFAQFWRHQEHSRHWKIGAEQPAAS